MLEDDFGDAGGGPGGAAGGGKMTKKKTNSPPKMHSGNTTMVASYHMKNSSPTMLPQRAMSLVPFQVQMPPDQALFSQVASIVDRLPVGQLISECLFDFLNFPKKTTKHLTNFCPRI